MAKPITAKMKAAFLKFCKEQIRTCQGSFSIGDFEPFAATDKEGEPLWEFHAENYTPNTYDIYELFESVEPKFEIETHGHDDFVVSKKETPSDKPKVWLYDPWNDNGNVSSLFEGLDSDQVKIDEIFAKHTSPFQYRDNNYLKPLTDTSVDDIERDLKAAGFRVKRIRDD